MAEPHMLIHRDEYNRLLQKIKDYDTISKQETKSKTMENGAVENDFAENGTVESDNAVTEDNIDRSNKTKNENFYFKKDLENIKYESEKMKSPSGGSASEHQQHVRGRMSKASTHKNTGKDTKTKGIKTRKNTMTKKEITKKLIPPGKRYSHNKPRSSTSKKSLKTKAKWLSV